MLTLRLVTTRGTAAQWKLALRYASPPDAASGTLAPVGGPRSRIKSGIINEESHSDSKGKARQGKKGRGKRRDSIPHNRHRSNRRQECHRTYQKNI